MGSSLVPRRALLWFALCELGIGGFGWWSLDIFQWAAASTLGMGHVATGVATFLLVLLPTALMGGTLPLLMRYATQHSGNVGHSLGNLYFVNTLGAAAGCFVTSGWLLGALGLHASVQLAAWLNAALGLAIWVMAQWGRQHP